MGFSILSFITIGMISARILKSGMSVDFDSLYRGFFTGFVTGITVFFCFYGNNFGLENFLLLFLITSISLLLGGIGAYIQYSWDQRKTISVLVTSKSPTRFGRRASPFAVSLILIGLVIIIPPVIAYAGIWTGIIEKSQPNLYCTDYEVSVNRISNDSFEIIQHYKCNRNITAMNNEHPYRHWFPHGEDPKPPYKVNIEIFMDGKEVTNMSIIQNQGLQDTIDPNEGLNDPQFHRTVLKGPDFIFSTTNPRHIVVYRIFNGNRYPLTSYTDFTSEWNNDEKAATVP